MSFYDAIRVGASGAADFEVERSLRFRRSNNTYLARTFGSAGNRRTFTFSTWIKTSVNSNTNAFFSGQKSGEGFFKFMFRDDHRIEVNTSETGSSDSSQLRTTRKFRDPSAWYHIVVAYDTTQGTASDRVKIYVNGTQETAFDTGTYPSQNHQHIINIDGDYQIGNQIGTSNYFDGYMAEVHFIDGLQLTPASFGETNAVTGQWVPKDTSSLTFGTNGFRIQLSDNSNTTATTLGKDTSGNSNNFTPNNVSISADYNNDSVVDTPTNNFPTLNPLSTFKNGSSSNTENANLRWNGVSNNQAGCVTSMAFPTSGKWYWEVRYLGSNSNFSFGITPAYWSQDINPSSPTGSIGYAAYGSKIVSGSETASWAASFTSSDVAAAALDMDNNEIKFYKNNSLQGTIALVSGYENVEYLAWIKGDTASTTVSSTINPGQQGFTYTPPTGFKALCSANLPDPTILLPNKHFNTVIYTGNGGTIDQDFGFNADWVWYKNRGRANTFHYFFDAVRGANKALYSNSANSENSEAASNYTQSFITNGSRIVRSSGDHLNESGDTYVSWAWNGGDTDSATYTVKVVSDGGNKYRFNNFGTSAVTLDLAEGGTYTFDGSDSSMSGHPFVIGTAANGTVYSTGVTYQLDGVSVTYSAYTSGYASASTRKLIITVPASAPVLYYWCSIHSGMGGQINTNSSLGSSNFDGTIQTTVKANTTAGFSIVSYTGNGTNNATIGHGLGVAPSARFGKARTLGTVGSAGAHWSVNHQNLNNGMNGGSSAGTVFLNLTAAQENNNHGAVGAVSATTMTLSDGSSGSVPRAHVNQNGNTYIQYVFSEVAGYSKFGEYSGNSNSNGTFVFLGFRPAWVMIRRPVGDNWVIKDATRNTFNDVFSNLQANQTYAESGSSNNVVTADFLSNGFKLRGTDSGVNGSGNTYIYFAFAESPFKNSRAR